MLTMVPNLPKWELRWVMVFSPCGNLRSSNAQLSWPRVLGGPNRCARDVRKWAAPCYVTNIRINIRINVQLFTLNIWLVILRFLFSRIQQGIIIKLKIEFIIYLNTNLRRKKYRDAKYNHRINVARNLVYIRLLLLLLLKEVGNARLGESD